MKTYRNFLLLAAAVISLTLACKKPEPAVEPSLEIPSATVKFASGDSAPAKVEIKSNVDWSASTSADWITISPASGNGDGTITITPKANVGPAGTCAEARNATVTVKIDGKSVDIKVSQGAETVVFAVDGGASLTAEGGVVKVKVEYNVPYQPAISVDWITPLATKAVATDELSFQVAPNTTTAERTGTITLTPSSGSAQSVTVKQAGMTVRSLKTAQDLKDFAAAVNEGNYTLFDPDGDGVYKLEADIDFGGADWTPIGAGTMATSGAIEETNKPFKGVFDGQGHTVDNFKVNVAADAEKGICSGFFGFAQEATIKNLKVGSKAILNSLCNNLSYSGLLLGGGLNTNVEGCESAGSITFEGGASAVRSVIGGVIGSIQVNGSDIKSDATVKNCIGNCKNISAKNTGNDKNGGTGVIVGGVLGYTDALGANTDYFVIVDGCVNNANFTTGGTRVGGVVGTPNKYTKIQNCTNNGNLTGNDTVASDSRVGGIAPTTGASCFITKCVNKGDITWGIAGTTTGFVAGVCTQPNSSGVVEECENYGVIRSDVIKNASKPYIGAIFAHANKAAAVIKNNKVEGSVGPLTEDDTYKVVVINKANFNDYISCVAPAKAENAAAVYEGNYCTVEAPAPAFPRLDEAAYLGISQDIYDEANYCLSTFAQHVVTFTTEAGTATVVLNTTRAGADRTSIPSGTFAADQAGTHAANTFAMKTLDGSAAVYTKIVEGGAEVAIADGEVLVVKNGTNYTITANLMDETGKPHAYVYEGPIENVQDKALAICPWSVAYQGDYFTHFAGAANQWNLSFYVSDPVAADMPYLYSFSVTIFGPAGKVDPNNIPTGKYTINETKENDATVPYDNGKRKAPAMTFDKSEWNYFTDPAGPVGNYGTANIDGGTVEITKNSDGSYNFDFNFDLALTVNDVTSAGKWAHKFTNVVLPEATVGSPIAEDEDHEFTGYAYPSPAYMGYWYGDSYGWNGSVIWFGWSTGADNNYAITIPVASTTPYEFVKTVNGRFCDHPVPNGTYTYVDEQPATPTNVIPNLKTTSRRALIKNTYTGTIAYVTAGSITINDEKILIDLTAKTTAGKILKYTGWMPNSVSYIQDYSAATRQTHVVWAETTVTNGGNAGNLGTNEW